MKQPLVVSYGGGTNSTAMLIEFVNRGIVPDLILFADTGGELPSTYEYVDTFSRWLCNHGLPEIVIVKNDGQYGSLEYECSQKGILPSLAYGFKSCSDKYKRRPQDKFISGCNMARAAWASGIAIKKAIGFDAGEWHRIRKSPDKKYENWFPLVDWDLGRDDCIRIIRMAGLKQPGRSSCFFCPAMRKKEILWLKKHHPDLLERAIEMERKAKKSGNLKTVQGLGRNFAWADLIAADEEQHDMFTDTVEISCMCFDGNYEDSDRTEASDD